MTTTTTIAEQRQWRIIGTLYELWTEPDSIDMRLEGVPDFVQLRMSALRETQVFRALRNEFSHPRYGQWVEVIATYVASPRPRLIVDSLRFLDQSQSVGSIYPVGMDITQSVHVFGEAIRHYPYGDLNIAGFAGKYAVELEYGPRIWRLIVGDMSEETINRLEASLLFLARGRFDGSGALLVDHLVPMASEIEPIGVQVNSLMVLQDLHEALETFTTQHRLGARTVAFLQEASVRLDTVIQSELDDIKVRQVVKGKANLVTLPIVGNIDAPQYITAAPIISNTQNDTADYAVYHPGIAQSGDGILSWSHTINAS